MVDNSEKATKEQKRQANDQLERIDDLSGFTSRKNRRVKHENISIKIKIENNKPNPINPQPNLGVFGGFGGFGAGIGGVVPNAAVNQFLRQGQGFGCGFGQKILSANVKEYDFLGSNKNTMVIGNNFDFEKNTIPTNVNKIIISDNTIKNIHLMPNTVTELYVEIDFNLDFLNNGIKKIFIKSDYYTHELDNLPETLEYLHIDVLKGYSGNLDNLPESLKHLIVVKGFNQSINNLPKNLMTLVFLTDFNQSIDYLPPNLKYLNLGNDFNQTIHLLPKNLVYLNLGHSFKNNMLCNFPPTLTNLQIGSIKNNNLTVKDFGGLQISFISYPTNLKTFINNNLNFVVIPSYLPKTLKEIILYDYMIPLLDKNTVQSNLIFKKPIEYFDSFPNLIEDVTFFTPCLISQDDVLIKNDENTTNFPQLILNNDSNTKYINFRKLPSSVKNLKIYISSGMMSPFNKIILPNNLEKLTLSVECFDYLDYDNLPDNINTISIQQATNGIISSDILIEKLPNNLKTLIVSNYVRIVNFHILFNEYPGVKYQKIDEYL